MALPPRVTDEIIAWWESLDDQERIIAALETYADDPVYVAEKPWKWAAEAYALRPQAECYVCTHLREQHKPEDCQVEDCDCRDFEPFPIEVR